jgi:hypothetical protein
VLLRLLVTVSAQAAGSSSASAAAPSSTPDMVMVFPGSGAWSYAGCYNETTGVANSGGVRALAGGTMVRNCRASKKGESRILI